MIWAKAKIPTPQASQSSNGLCRCSTARHSHVPPKAMPMRSRYRINAVMSFADPGKTTPHTATVTAASASHGAQLAITADGEMPEPKAWAFNMKDGIRKVRLYIPNGQVTDLPDMTFTAGDAINIPVTITCYPDSNGVLYQVFTDDGITNP